MTLATDNGGVSYEWWYYDALDRLTLDKTAEGNHRYYVKSIYDNAANRATVTIQVDNAYDFREEFVYDKLGRMTQAIQKRFSPTAGNQVAPKRANFTYDGLDRQDTVTRYADTAGTQLVATTDRTYDPAGRLTALTHTKGGTTLAGYGYTFDEGNRLTQMVSTADGTVAYGYDPADQLASADYSTSQPDESYLYDDNGNRTNGGFATGEDNRLLTDGAYTYSYDPEGNRTARYIDANANQLLDTGDTDITEYAWDHRNRLSSVTARASYGGALTHTVTYTYDVLNRLVGRNEDADGAGPGGTAGRHYVSDALDRILEIDRADGVTVKHRYLFGPAVDQVLADEAPPSNTQAGPVLWPLADHLGTVKDLAQYDPGTNTTTVVNHRVFDSYGNLVSETNAAVDYVFGFTGFLTDKPTDLDMSQTRPYDPRTGRWIQEDRIGFEGRDANLSRYCRNSPTNHTDRSGLSDDDESLFYKFAINFWGGRWISRAIWGAPEAARQAGEELGRLYGDATSAEIDRRAMERRLRDLRTPEDYKRVYGDQWREAMEQTARLAKIGVQANIILGGMVIRPGTIMASGCDQVAGQVQKIVGGTVVKITPKGRLRWLGGFAGKQPAWAYHTVVVSGGRVYDSYTGIQGMLIEEYKKLWEHASDINFGF